MAGKSNGVDVTEWARAPPKKLPLGERILRSIYDPDDNTFLGRTPKRWGIMVVFYAIFYAVLAAMFSLCMGGLFMCLPDDRPLYLMEKSLIGGNPGVTSRPLARDEVVVRYSLDNATGYDTYVEELTTFMKQYENDTRYNSKSECSVQDNFGYPTQPCFFIKINKIYGWEPQLYDADDADLHAELPADLLNYVAQLPDKQRNQIWVSCWDEGGENSTRLEYPWGRALPASAYPYTKQKDYHSPLVTVKITPASNNTLVTVRCRAYAKNIIYNKSLKEASGYARIQLRIDETDKP